MKRVLLILLLLIFALTGLSAITSSPLTRYPDPSLSVSYYGDFSDLYSNPAAFAFRENAGTMFNIGLSADTVLNGNGLTDNYSDIILSFGGRTVSFSAVISTFYTNPTTIADVSYLDIISIPHIQIDYAYSFWDTLSIGARVQGGNSSARKQKKVDSVLDLIRQSYFAEYDRVKNSEYFSVGLGALVKYELFSFGVYSDNMLLLSENGRISASLSDILDSLTLGASFQMDKFNEKGELNFIRPRLGISLENVASKTNGILELQIELLIQLLQTFNIRIATSYREKVDFSSVNFNPKDKAIHATSLSIQYYDFELSLLLGVPLKSYLGEKSDDGYAKLTFVYSY